LTAIVNPSERRDGRDALGDASPLLLAAQQLAAALGRPAAD
jgi:hypothetical protein